MNNYIIYFICMLLDYETINGDIKMNKLQDNYVKMICILFEWYDFFILIKGSRF